MSNVRLQSVVRISAQGVSRPYVCQDNAGNLFWCKGNHTGLRALMSEWVCARIAQAVSLPVPECCILKLDPDCFRAWCNCNGGGFPQLVTEANPYVFASKNVEAAKDVIGVDTDLADADPLLLAKIYLFDAFIHNTDRTDYNSNLLVNHSVHVIDHNNAFDGAFDKRLFANEHILRSFFERTSPSALSSFEQELRDTASPTFLGTIWSEMPDEWRDVGEAVFSPKKVMEITSTRCAP